MQIYNGFNDKCIKRKPRCLAIGVFDGVHRGHKKIISSLLANAKRYRTGSMVVTFEPHPKKVLKPKVINPNLISLPHRLRFFKEMGIDEALVIRFNKQFSKIPHRKFLYELLIKRLGMKALSVGEDFCFGFKGRGDAKYLKEESRRSGFGLALVKPLKHGSEVISSTLIRRLIERGDLKKAEKMLGRPVSVYGIVVRGRGRGRSLGFPTANLNPHHETLPPTGVYAAKGHLGRQWLKGVIHIGHRPTFNDLEKSLEVHFFNFNRDIYGKEIELAFVSKLRATRKFKDRNFLIRAIQKDAQKALKVL